MKRAHGVAGLACSMLLTGPMVQAADPAAGKFWYEQRCAQCHGSPPQERQAGTPNITGRSAERIRQALVAVPAMAKVNLDASQVLDVEAYLQAPLDYEWAPRIDYSDVWYQPDEAGWGLTFTQRPNSRSVAFLYLYEPTGQPLWLLASELTWQTSTQVSGRLLRADSAGFPPLGFDPAGVRLRDVGTVSVQFNDAGRAQIEYVIDGLRYQKRIQRLPF